MLTHPISRQLYTKFASAPAGWLAQNIRLAGKAALLVYRKCGRSEASAFIALLRLQLYTDF